ncbi:MAG: fibronectin type III domain-containing protein, partial [Kiritimatiellae bacterium]|nr:fibronectin type III domain-containing protein [Kiritimatiellia bacterium]
PAAPDNLAAAALSATQIRLTWQDNSANEEKFKIDRRISGTTNWVRVAEPTANTTVYTDSGLSANTHYYYTVKAANAGGDSPYSNTAGATTDSETPPVPAAPGNLTAEALSASRIRLTWQDNSANEDTFKIDRRVSGTSVWVGIAKPAVDATVFTDSGLSANTHYYYMVKAANAGGDSPYSNTADATTTSDSGLPAGAAWRYRKGTAEPSVPPAAWRGATFDDSHWAEGNAPFGYGDGPYGTTLDDMHGSYLCVFLRRTLQVDSPPTVSAMQVWTLYDDGFVMWVNGQEVARVNVAGEPGAPLALDTHASTSIEPTEWNATLSGGALPALEPGTNVVTVCVFNATPDSSDLTFDMEVVLVPSVLSATVDPDGNTMPDNWEAVHLADLADPADRSGAGDPDGDGLSNIEEYIAGTDPRQNDSWFRVDTALSGGQVIVSFQTEAATGAGYEGLTRYYSLEERSGAETDWLSVPDYADIVGAGQSVVYTNAGDHSAYYRARTWLE